MVIKEMYSKIYDKIILRIINNKKEGKKENKFDYILFFMILFLIFLGIIVIIVKLNAESVINISCYIHRVKTLAYMLFGIFMGLLIYFSNYKKIKKISLSIYLIATLIMLLTIIPGVCIKVKNVYYINMYLFTVQIAIIALPLYIISFVGFIIDDEKNNEKCNNKKIKSIKKKIGIFLLAIISLILMIVNLSFTNMIILAISYLITITSKIMKEKKHRILKLGTIYGVIISIIGVFTIIILLQQLINWSKVEEYINVNIESADDGSNMILQREIIRKAKMVGEAENLSAPIDETVFYSESNYTFIYIIGKLGLYYAELIVLVYVFIALKLMLNVKKVQDEYGRYLIVGLGALFIVQSFATMFVNISLGIYADVNLPFITYGGSYFIINMFEIALIFSIYRRRIMYNIES